MNKILLILLALIMVMTVCSSCTSQTTLSATIIDDLGRPISIKEIPERIVSLAPSATEILYALELGDYIVAVTDYCDYPDEAKDKPKAGAPFPGFDIEGIVAHEPDVVFSIAGTVVDKLENVGLTVVVLQARDIDGIYKDIEIVGRITDKNKEASELVNDMKERVDAIAVKTVEAINKPTVFYEIDASWNENKPWTVGHGTFQDDIINLAGGRNIASGRQGWFELSIEEILDADPDIIILEDYQYGITPEIVIGRSSWHGLTAVQEENIYTIADPNLTSRPGPRIVDGLEQIARNIHPELFE